jgi:putative sugar O-methyltransferase
VGRADPRADALAGRIRAMSEALSRSCDPLTGESPEWDRIGRAHAAALERDGLADFKRTVNFQYGQSAMVSIRSTQMRHVLRQVLAGRVAPRAALGARMERAGAPQALGGHPWRRFVYRFFVGLVWDLARARDRLGCLEGREESAVGNPIGIRFAGRRISEDLAQSAFELNTICAVVPPGELERVAEIGAGYGRLAHMVLSAFPTVSYWIYDVPPALAVSEMYLKAVLGSERVLAFERRDAPRAGEVRMALPPALRDVADGYFDLIASVYCLDGLTPRQIEAYLGLMDAKCRGWIYLKGGKSGVRGSAAPLGLPDLPYPARWRLVHEATEALHPENVEYVFDLRG